MILLAMPYDISQMRRVVDVVNPLTELEHASAAPPCTAVVPHPGSPMDESKETFVFDLGDVGVGRPKHTKAARQLCFVVLDAAAARLQLPDGAPKIEGDVGGVSVWGGCESSGALGFQLVTSWKHKMPLDSQHGSCFAVRVGQIYSHSCRQMFFKFQMSNFQF